MHRLDKTKKVFMQKTILPELLSITEQELSVFLDMSDGSPGSPAAPRTRCLFAFSLNTPLPPVPPSSLIPYTPKMLHLKGSGVLDSPTIAEKTISVLLI